MTAVQDIPLRTIEGEDTSLAAYDGQVLLVVNVASKCGLTPQYDGLEKLHERFRDSGFSVLGFPANDFMGQEPGTDEEIAEFCRSTFDVQFPMFSKIVVKGEGQHPLYAALTEAVKREDGSVDVQWNFEKFLISRTGEVVGRFSPRVTPEDETLVEAIQKQL
ncbi:glutathione peroxidase [Paractinoplanes atraurantiacus]|uniref:Glutathione peroxidase n=1 Tax=Paractinoplanes atraurantiacus TaxID=1036182 RepID=A0A285F3F9_9ACTN|nr:glutathione peroxidase [Actinoplanes atraurantiacus]SNY04711.1 glutathione peroxidase [Actinoplanes atraurantiacus]